MTVAEVDGSRAWIARVGSQASGARLAVKDSIDVAGFTTSLGNAVIARRREAATADATCVAMLRAAGATLVGKTNLHEFCFGTTGVNASFGTPDNPRWPGFVPGGSSSGSASAVAAREADIGLGTDTGGSIRIPAACCGIVGLKLTNGAVPCDGVWPLSPRLDALGLLARSVRELEPWVAALGIDVGPMEIRRIGVVKVPGVDPETMGVIDRATHDVGLPVDILDGLSWTTAARATEIVLVTDAHRSITGEAAPDELQCGWDIRTRLDRAARIRPSALDWALEFQAAWAAELGSILDTVDVIAVPTLFGPPPRSAGPQYSLNRLTSPVNLAGLPAIAIPLTLNGSAPVSLQLIARAHGEGRAMAAGSVFEDTLEHHSQPAEASEVPSPPAHRHVTPQPLDEWRLS